MPFFPASLDNLVDRFASLPGIGRKSAQRLAFHVLALPDDQWDLIQELDHYVWGEAAAQIREWKEHLGVTLPVSVNVSRVDILRGVRTARRGEH